MNAESKKESIDKNNNIATSYSSSGSAIDNSPISKTELDSLFDYYEKRFEKQDGKIENQKLTIIETLGIFVALFTFISIDFQVFRSYRNPYAVGGLSLMLLGAIAFLLVIFDFYILQARAIKNDVYNKYKNDGFFLSVKERYKNNSMSVVVRILLFGCSLIFIFSGLLLFCNSSVEKFEDERNQIKNEVLNLVQSNLDNQKKDLEKINHDNSAIIKTTNNSIIEFKKCIKNFGFTYKCFEE